MAFSFMESSNVRVAVAHLSGMVTWLLLHDQGGFFSMADRPYGLYTATNGGSTRQYLVLPVAD